MNRDYICRRLVESGYDAKLTDGDAKLRVEFPTSRGSVTLIHEFPRELLHVPKFYLARGHGFGKLAHVLERGNDQGGEVCIADTGSTSVNIDRPELAYRDTVREHVELLTRLIEDTLYNERELLREFVAHWQILCREEGGALKEIFVAWDGRNAESLKVKAPSETQSIGLRSKLIALSAAVEEDARLAGVRESASWTNRQAVGNAIALRLNGLEPAPATRNDLLAWYFRALSQVDEAACQRLRWLRKKNSRDYWLVFSGETPDGETMCAVHWRAPNKGPLPKSVEDVEAGQWTLTPYHVRSLSQTSLVPRGGGALDLGEKSVLLVGCGSVGSELAHQLTSAGLGHLTISDPESLSEENLYRHTLSVKDVDKFKSNAVATELTLKHPWAQITSLTKYLEALRDSARLRQFDLVVIAVGSPTVERAFAAYCRDEGVEVAAINCWVEGYGIGGHATLVIPGPTGCWHCAYVDPRTLKQELASNLNFLAPNQIVLRNHGGCGTQYLPYSGIAASQTASMTADLAVRFLSGDVKESSRVSWKGNSTEAERASLETTWRYHHFTESLQVLPLHDQNCDVCGG